MKKFLQIVILFLVVLLQNVMLQAQIQRTYHWYFGGNAGIDFSSGQAVADTSGEVNTWDGCAAISDTEGNLLFYTDGSTVWNKNHQIMPNGTGLMGNWSSHQNSLIVPKPQNSRIYYIFTTDAQENNFQNGLRYSTIDISLDNGLGDITDKNILLVAPTHEQLAATFHSNCEDIWVITHKRNEEKFYAYLITASGVNTNPIITEIGNATQLLWGCFGFKISPNGEKIMSGNFWDWWNTGAIDTIELYDFNKTTGMFSNRNILIADTVNYNSSFSPDSKKLFVTGGGNFGYGLYQFNLASSNINSSKLLVAVPNPHIAYYDAQFSPVNGKIYLTRANTDSLAIINNPNAIGTACNFVDRAFSLNGKQSMASFPNFISTYFDTDSASCFFTLVDNIMKVSEISVYPNPAFNSKQITIKNENIKVKKINLFTITGREVFVKTKTLQDEIRLDISDISSGIYLIKLTEENKTETRKLVIQNE